MSLGSSGEGQRIREPVSAIAPIVEVIDESISKSKSLESSIGLS